MTPLAVTLSATDDRHNEDAYALGDGVVVVVDGAGLPKDLRRGCDHSVRWYANALAGEFRDRLVPRDCDMRTALSSAIGAVAAAHRRTCRLEEGSPSATVAAWRLQNGVAEYLVLSDASIILGFREGGVVEVTDDRLAQVTGPIIEARLNQIRATRAVVPADVRQARRDAVEQTRNRPGGFWCAHHDPDAAFAAINDSVDRGKLATIVAASDGATRGFQLLGAHSLRGFLHSVTTGDTLGVLASIRDKEHTDESLVARGFKIHDDATLVVLNSV